MHQHHGHLQVSNQLHCEVPPKFPIYTGLMHTVVEIWKAHVTFLKGCIHTPHFEDQMPALCFNEDQQLFLKCSGCGQFGVSLVLSVLPSVLLC